MYKISLEFSREIEPGQEIVEERLILHSERLILHSSSDYYFSNREWNRWKELAKALKSFFGGALVLQNKTEDIHISNERVL